LGFWLAGLLGVGVLCGRLRRRGVWVRWPGLWRWLCWVVVRWWARMGLSRLWVAARRCSSGSALAAVVRAGAWPGEQLGEDGFGDAGGSGLCRRGCR
jgi:hypothetical protein